MVSCPICLVRCLRPWLSSDSYACGVTGHTPPTHQGLRLELGVLAALPYFCGQSSIPGEKEERAHPESGLQLLHPASGNSQSFNTFLALSCVQ